MRSLTNLIRKSEKFNWQAEYQEAFDMLKKHFTSAPILRHFDHELQRIIECNASDSAIRAIVSQEVEERLHTIAFYSRKMNKQKINYEIHDKELLAITSTFKEWRWYLTGT